MKRFIVCLSLFLVACADSCAPQSQDITNCLAACGARGISKVTFSKCECASTPAEKTQ